VLESEPDLRELQDLLDRSRAGATKHLRDIIGDDRALTAAEVAGLLTGMKVLALSTVTAGGEPRISCVDGHFLHGTWTFSTDGAAAKARHIEARPAVSAAHVDGEDLALFAHGVAERLEPEHEGWDETLGHWTAHYGESPLGWGDDVRLYRLRPTFMVGYASDRPGLLARRGVTPA
jgi:general stress protein 26